tara:strand:+ start:405 stop:614 length:210 start_codon:yes stop_codon:yes gene_type:complete
MKFECIKGMADGDNINVVVMQGDIVTFDDSDEGEVSVTGIAGWCEGFELIFTPKQFVDHFKVIGISYVL